MSRRPHPTFAELRREAELDLVTRIVSDPTSPQDLVDEAMRYASTSAPAIPPPDQLPREVAFAFARAFAMLAAHRAATQRASTR